VYGEVDENLVANKDNVKRVIFCSGKFYYELVAEREKRGKDSGLYNVD